MIEFLARAFGGDKSAHAEGARSASIWRCKAAARYGAFTWGVLDHLLDDGRLTIEGISGTSAGAVNAVMLADGLDARRAGRSAQAARRFLARGEPRRRSAGRAARGDRPAVLAAAGRRLADVRSGFKRLVAISFALRLNPLNINPLKDLIERFVDFDAAARRRRGSSSSPPPMCRPAGCIFSRARRFPPKR